jgi:hypothetical protein
MSMIARVLWLRRRLRQRERWTERQLREHQRRELASLRGFAAAQSPFYRRWHAGLDDAPLGELPVLTKATLMDNFDQIATDPAVRLADVQDYLAALRGDQLFRPVLGVGHVGKFRPQERHRQQHPRVGHHHRLVRAGQ